VRFQVFSGTAAVAVNVAGFSDQIQLGDIGAVKQDLTPVMRVQLEGELPSGVAPLWRGHGLDQYESGAWSVGNPAEDRLRSRWGTHGRRFYTERPPEEGAWVTQDIVLEPLAENVLFALPGARQIEGSFGGLTEGVNDSVYFHGRGGRLTYRAVSQVPVAPKAGRTVLPPMGGRAYLQIPSELRGSLTAIAQNVTDGAESDPERVQALLDHFSGFRYSLDPPAPEGDPVLHFLQASQEGYCEHYASAMTLLARSLGMPARVGTGFVGGDYNDVGDYWLVRQSDAHAWTEIYFESVGWIPFDPTPPAPPQSGMQQARRWVDYLRMLWIQRVGEYDMGDQLRFLQAAGSRGYALRARASRLLGSSRTWLPWILAVAGGLVLLGVVARRMRRRPMWQEPRVGQEQWERVRRLLRRHGVVQSPQETPQELAQRAVADLGPGWEELTEIARLYSHVRYDPEAAEQGAGELGERVERLRANAPRHGKRPRVGVS
jgi:transglutaminase-like putative cysteine protease